MKNILVISPHPDDEVIGCGGTLAKKISEGYRIEVIFLTSGEKGINGKSEEEAKRIREQESVEVSGFFNFNKIEFWEQKDGELYPTNDLIFRLKRHIEQYSPHEIFVTHFEEQHPDHHNAAVLVKEAISTIKPTLLIPEVWMFEVWTPLQEMDLIVDISEFIEIKRKGVQMYKSQCRILKFDEAIIGLNRYRGEMHSWPGGNYAEVFKKMKI